MSRGKPLILGALAACTALALSACGSSARGTTITLYNGQHEQTTAALVAAFEKQTGIKVEVRTGDEAELGNQILQEGSSSPADVFYTENTPVLEALREHGLLAPVAPSTLAAVPSRYDSAQGDWVGVSARVSVLVYNTSQIKPARTAELDPGTGRPKVEGQGRLRPLGDRLPAADHRDRQARRARHGRTLAEGTAGQQQDLPRQRDGRRAGQQRRERGRADQPLLLVPPARGDRRGRDALGAALLRGGQPRRPRERLRRRDPEVQLPPGGRAEAPRVPGQQDGAGDDRPQPQLRVPAAPWRRPGPRAASVRRACSRRR